MGRFTIKEYGEWQQMARLKELKQVETDVKDSQDKIGILNGKVKPETPLNTTSQNLSGAVNEVKDDLVAHKEEYIQQRQQDNLKVATVEKGLNDYKSTMASVNVNQEAKQKVTGYGTISLPKNTANGQVSMSVKGLTVTSLLGNTKFKSTITPTPIMSIRTSGILASDNTTLRRLVTLINAHKYYCAIRFSENTANITKLLVGGASIVLPTKPLNGLTIGGVFVSNEDRQDSFVYIATDSTGSLVYENSILINLTQTFGAGNEPSNEQCDKIFTNYLDGTKSTVSASRLKSESTDKTQKSLMYLPNVGELRSVGIVKDEIIKADGVWKHIKRIDNDGVTILVTPIITPIQVSGNLISYPNGTVYVENVVADAGNYTTKFDIKELQLPIKSIDKLIKYNFTTGVQTVLDTTLAVINEDKKSFTHPNLAKDDMVFVDYFYDVESTLGETTIEYLDSRHTIEDSVNNKFYSWDIESANGVPTVSLTEVL